MQVLLLLDRPEKGYPSVEQRGLGPLLHPVLTRVEKLHWQGQFSALEFSNGIDTKMKLDRTIFSILNRKEPAYSCLFWIEDDQKSLLYNFLEHRKNKSSYSKIFRLEEDQKS